MRPIKSRSHREVRSEFSGLLRALYTGRITNDDFEDKALSLVDYDRAVDQVYYLGAFPSYDDTGVYRLRGKDALSRDDRRHVARWILFLKSENPYLWPDLGLSRQFYLMVFSTLIVVGAYLHGWAGASLGLLFSIFALSLGDTFYERRRWNKLRTKEDRAVWPFFSKAEYNLALDIHPFFAARGIRAGRRLILH